MTVAALALSFALGQQKPLGNIGQEFMSALLGRMTTVHTESGPAKAAEVCATEAPQIAAKFSSLYGVAIYRISDRRRNPMNAPSVSERRVWRTWDDQVRKSEKPNDVVLQPVEFVDEEKGGSVTKLMVPIRIAKSICLDCHGSERDIDPATKAILMAKYPQDRAIGYRMGDLRGALVVKRRL